MDATDLEKAATFKDHGGRATSGDPPRMNPIAVIGTHKITYGHCS